MTAEIPVKVAEQLEKGAQYLQWWLNDKDSDSIGLQRERAHHLREAGLCYKAIIETLQPDRSLLFRVGNTALRTNMWTRNPYDLIELRGHRNINPGEALAFVTAHERTVPYLRLQTDAQFREPIEMNLSNGLLDVPMSELAKALDDNAKFSVVTLEEGRAIGRRH
ncbi:MAG TPA: hypothetical protein V6C72_03280 [Chroococcales cyanobacterium]